MPQYSSPRTSTSGTISVDGAITAGASNFKVDGFGSVTGGLRPGDMFNFNSSNSNHKKAYQITRVLTNSDYLTGGTQPATDERIYYVTPPIEKAVEDNATLNYGSNTLIRVVQTSDVQEYDLATNNLYQFSLSLEEAQP